MGRGNVRSSAASSASSRNKWYKQTIKRNDPGKRPYDQSTFEGKRMGILGNTNQAVPARSLQRTDRGRPANRRYQQKKLRQQALREAQRRNLSPAEAKTYVTKRVRELHKRDRARENRRQIAREGASAARQEKIVNSWERYKNKGFNTREELAANRAGKSARNRREKQKQRERIRQRARRRAQGAQTRSLQSLRRPTPDAPHLRPARRRRQNLTDAQRDENRRTGMRIAGEKNWRQAKREGSAELQWGEQYNSNDSQWGYDIKL